MNKAYYYYYYIAYEHNDYINLYYYYPPISYYIKHIYIYSAQITYDLPMQTQILVRFILQVQHKPGTPVPHPRRYEFHQFLNQEQTRLNPGHDGLPVR